jgi:MPBQ/MSBQ methyltransferase
MVDAVIHDSGRNVGAHSAWIGEGYTRAADRDLFGEYFGHSDFLNFGYWREDTTSQREACENLVDELLAIMPTTRGTILDVGCGKGATTRQLTRYYAPEAITGINVSEGQLERCRDNAPGCTFMLMDATNLDFPDRTFDALMSVEAAVHFDPRQDFLREARRVLKPGGWLVLADPLLARWSPVQPPANYVETPAEYRCRCLEVGFASADVRDVTENSVHSANAELRHWALTQWQRGEMGPAELRGVLRWIRRCRRSIRSYVIAGCQKG